MLHMDSAHVNSNLFQMRISLWMAKKASSCHLQGVNFQAHFRSGGNFHQFPQLMSHNSSLEAQVVIFGGKLRGNLHHLMYFELLPLHFALYPNKKYDPRVPTSNISVPNSVLLSNKCTIGASDYYTNFVHFSVMSLKIVLILGTSNFRSKFPHFNFLGHVLL